MSVPNASWSTDTVSTISATVWLARAIAARELRSHYAAQRQATIDLVLRVVSGVHELAVDGITPDRPVWGEDHDPESCTNAVCGLCDALDIEVPASGPLSNWLLQLVVSELLRRLLELVNEDPAVDA